MKSIGNSLIRTIRMIPRKGSYFCYMLINIISSVCSPFASAILISIIVKNFEDDISVFSLLLPLLFIFFVNTVNMLFSAKMEKRNFLFRLSLVSKLIEKSTRLDISFLESKEGKSAHTEAKRAVLEGNNVGIEIFLNKFVSLIVSVICVLIELVIIFQVSIIATIILLVSVIAIVYINFKIEKKDELVQKDLSECYGEIEELDENVIEEKNQKDIYSYSVGDLFREKYKKKREMVLKHWKRSSRLYVQGESLSILLSLIRELLIGIILFQLLEKGEISLAYFLFVMSSTVYFKDWQDSLLYDFQDIFQNNLIVRHFLDFLSIPNTYLENLTNESLPNINSIELQNVSYSYDGDENVISNINVHIRKGEKIALVGMNGAGKTTLAKILLGIYSPSSGALKVNGKNIRNYSLEDYKKHFASSFQKNIVFPFTIKENITCVYKNECDDEMFDKSINTAKIKDLVLSMKYGFDSNLTKELDNEGIELSGGQLQRLLLARTMYQDSDIVILDEPTSALDPIIESEIFNAYKAILKDKTAIFITHKLISVKNCDRIYVIQDGKITEAGTHDELMKNENIYYNLYTTQAEQYIEHNRKVEK